jgi:hypothetical protein
MKKIYLSIFITSLLSLVSCDVSQITGKLEIVCNGVEVTDTFIKKPTLHTETKKEQKTTLLKFSDKKLDEMKCSEWNEQKISCRSETEWLNYLFLDRVTGNIQVNNNLTTDEGKNINVTFKGNCSKLKENKI